MKDKTGHDIADKIVCPRLNHIEICVCYFIIHILTSGSMNLNKSYIYTHNNAPMTKLE